ncbi:unnamed protein product [Sympodiomycopsis kandeliae]
MSSSVVNERSPLLEAANPFDSAEQDTQSSRRESQSIHHQASRDSLISARSFIDHEARKSRSNSHLEDPRASIARRDADSEDFEQDLSPSASALSGQGQNSRSPSSFVGRNLGLLLLLLAQLNYSTMALAYQVLARITEGTAHPVTPLQVIFARMSLTWLGCVIALRVTKTPHPVFGPPEVRKLLVARGIVGFFGLSGFYISLKYLSLSDATVITFLSPILTGFLCMIFLKEAFTQKELLAAIASLVGVLLIARPKSLFGRGQQHDGPVGGPVGEEAITTLKNHATEGQRLFAVAIALMGTLGSAGAYTLIRSIGTRASALHSVSYFALYSSLASWFLGWLNDETWSMPQEKRGSFFVLLCLCGTLGFAAQWLAAMGLQREKGGRATVTVYTQAIWSTIYQVVFLREMIAPLSALGCLIILASAMIVALTK